MLPQLPTSSIILLFSPPSSKLNNKRSKSTRIMNLTKMKFIPFLVIFLSIISVFRFLKSSIIITTTISSSPPPSTHKNTQFENSILTIKELNLLSNLIANKTPCNLLFFGLEPEYLNISSINKAGINFFLHDHPSKMEKLINKSNPISTNALFYKVEYETAAREAFHLLKYARQNPDCSPGNSSTKCKLAMKRLPKAVMEKNWDIVVVDGPDGDREDAPGRMEAIYTAGLIARTWKKNSGSTDILVHDKDRMIEKWFSWEFLCDDNLVSTKGKFWHFRILAGNEYEHRNSYSNSTFCSSPA